MMKTFTTKEAAKLVRRELGERARQLGLAVIEDESGAIQLEATTDEIEDFERLGNPAIDSDVIADDLMAKFLAYLESEELLEPPQATESAP
jgi:hypothetical protein